MAALLWKSHQSWAAEGNMHLQMVPMAIYDSKIPQGESNQTSTSTQPSAMPKMKKRQW